MGATNTTTYYNLSQFIGTDKPAWLQDYNGDMLKIDTAINNAKIAADNAANAASAAQNDATTALGDIVTINGNISTINTTLGTAVGNINTINSLIGNGTPTTTDQTIIGAINELNAGKVSANDVSGKMLVKTLMESVAVTGITSSNTFQDAASAILAKINAKLATLTANEKLVIDTIVLNGLTAVNPIGANYYGNSDTVSRVTANSVSAGGTQVVSIAMEFDSDFRGGYARIAYSDGTVTAGSYGDSDNLSTANITSINIKWTVYEEL